MRGSDIIWREEQCGDDASELGEMNIKSVVGGLLIVTRLDVEGQESICMKSEVGEETKHGRIPLLSQSS